MSHTPSSSSSTPPKGSLEPESPSPRDSQAALDSATAEAFHKVAAYLRGELLTTSEDYHLIQLFASIGQQKLKELRPTLDHLDAHTTQLGQMDREMQTCLESIDDLERRVEHLVALSSEVDRYAGLIEEKVKDCTSAPSHPLGEA